MRENRNVVNAYENVLLVMRGIPITRPLPQLFHSPNYLHLLGWKPESRMKIRIETIMHHNHINIQCECENIRIV